MKYFLEDPSVVDLPAIIPVFHRWIQNRSVEGILVDVADYQHVHEGPGIMLIGYEGDYSLDMSEGRPGLLYLRKRMSEGSFRDRLREVFRRVLLACRVLEGEEALAGKIRFRTGEAELSFLDRRWAPNTKENFDSLSGEVETFLGVLYNGREVIIERRSDDERECLGLRISASGTTDLTVLIDRAGSKGS